MSLSLTLIMLVAIIAPAWAAPGDPHLAWARSDGGTFSAQGRGVAVDADGNSVVVGQYSGSATFGSGEPNVTTLSSTAGVSAFVASYDASGLLRWARSIHGTTTVVAEDVAVDADGNALVVGRFAGTATFGSGQPNETVLASAGNFDAFVASYDASGALRWVRGARGTLDVQGMGVAVDADGNATVTGFFGGTATFSGGETSPTVLASAGGQDVFVASFDASGTLRWAHRAGGPNSDQGLAVAVDADGSAVVTGHFFGTATFGSGEANQTILTSAAFGSDAFVASYDTDGVLRWASRVSGSGVVGSGVAMDPDGNVVVTGHFAMSVTLGTGDHETTLVSEGNDDAFVASYDTSGTLRWARSVGGAFTVRGEGVAVDVAGNAVVTGRFFGLVTFGEDEVSFLSGGSDDTFVASYDDAGVLSWARHAGGTASVQGAGVAVGPGGDAIVTGRFNGTVTFSLGETDAVTLVSGGRDDVFVVRYAIERDAGEEPSGPSEELAGPGDQLAALAAFVADKGYGLSATVAAAQRSLDRNNDKATCSQLQALVRQADAQARGSRLASEDADVIVDDASKIITALGCGDD